MTFPRSKHPSDRRDFFYQGLLATAATYAATSNVRTSNAADEIKELSPNEKLSVAVVGVGGRGGSHLQALANGKKTTVTHICDCDEKIGQKRCEEIGKVQGGRKPEWVQDIRKLVEEKSIDVVTIATPNHWHSLGAIWAIEAGKDVYVEKPVSHNVWEGSRVVAAAKKHNRVVQTGTQSRSNPGMREAMEFIHGGGIGEVKIARGLCYKPRGSIGKKGNYPVPEGVDYDLWSGPAPLLPITRPKFHYDWHWQWAYGNGDLGNQGIHQMDLCRWALKKDSLAPTILSYGGRFGYEDAGETANTQVVVHDYGSQQLVFEVRGLKTENYQGVGVGIIIEGTQGKVVMTSYSSGAAFDLEDKPIKKFNGGDDAHHYSNFVEAVLARDASKLNAPIQEGHLSSALCHLGNISLRLGNPIDVKDFGDYSKDLPGSGELKATFDRTISHLESNEIKLDSIKITAGPALKFNPESETFAETNGPLTEKANAMLTREYRAPYLVT